MQKRYDVEFKKMIVKFYEDGKSVKELTKEYEISEVTLYSWIKKYKTITSDSGDVTTNDDLAKMKKEMAKLREENEVLKKCISIFSVKEK